MKRINETYENTIVINKSEFITHLFRVNSLEEVEKILSETRKKYYDATHNCYAYILGDNAEIQKASDDGEPAKTAGAPMIDVLKKNNVTNILAITTRYFGGILLGAGGLVRAYSSSVSECLNKARFYEIQQRVKFSLTTSYAGYNTILKALPYITIDSSSFTTDVLLEANCTKEEFIKLKDDLYQYKIDANTLNEIGIFPVEIELK